MSTPIRSGKPTLLKVASILLTAIPLFAAQADAATRDVNCDKGQSLQEAVMKGQGSAEHLYIDVRGYCAELVTIERDHVTIDGDGEATVAAFSVQGGRRITLSSLTVTGPITGVEVAQGDVKLIDVTMTQNSDFGLLLDRASTAVVESSTVTENNTGIEANNGSNVTVIDSDISFNYEGGINANQSSVLIDNTTITQNGGWTALNIQNNSSIQINYSNVLNNSESAAFVANSSCFESDNTHYTNNGEAGIVLAINSSALMGGGGSIQGHSALGILVKEHSFLDIRDTVISNNSNGMQIAEDGGVILRSGVAIIGNGFGVWCADSESSFILDDAFIGDPVECTDFNQPEPTP